GQGVNTAESKAVLRWHVGNSTVFSAEEKALIREKASNMTGEDEIVIHCSEQRNQLANKKLCVERLHEIVDAAMVVAKKRVPTRVTLGQKNRALDNKAFDARKKQQRRAVDSD
ncbi:MAG: aminoacyl-tRNA hydrolase, partial [Candidatus Uhrbacteria bacterium]